MRPILFLLCFLSVLLLTAQNEQYQQLAENYAQFEEASLTDRRFKLSDLEPLLETLPENFKVQKEGESVEGRPIYRVTVGSGSITVLLWSQMHGDEPTATAAIFDIFNFLQSEEPAFQSLRERILSELTLVFLPMLNPDGAEKFERRNALGIDLNRDALRLTSPEAQLLKRVRDELDADWGFNLHDQSRFYGAGYPTDEMATLAFLAPAYDLRRSVNAGRERAMQLIGEMNVGLQTLAPGRIARYSDAFEARAFGDNMQLWGTSTILIESGGNWEDREKQEIRKLNFVSLINAFSSIASKSYTRFSRSDYNKIPYNRGGLFNDLLLREVSWLRQGETYLMDIAFDLSERDYDGHRAFYFNGKIDDVGDLTYQRGYEELAAQNLTVEVGYAYPEIFENMAAFKTKNPLDLLRAGYVVVRVKRQTPPWTRDQLPFVITGPDRSYDQTIAPGKNPPLLVKDSQGTIKFVVVNGQLFDLENLDLGQW